MIENEELKVVVDEKENEMKRLLAFTIEKSSKDKSENTAELRAAEQKIFGLSNKIVGLENNRIGLDKAHENNVTKMQNEIDQQKIIMEQLVAEIRNYDGERSELRTEIDRLKEIVFSKEGQADNDRNNFMQRCRELEDMVERGRQNFDNERNELVKRCRMLEVSE